MEKKEREGDGNTVGQERRIQSGGGDHGGERQHPASTPFLQRRGFSSPEGVD